ncbi:MAG: FHA domain-containing protein [Chloroflexi bacterium]|nr:FHA domain-containing protein [Chloroflexota bacterium]
MAVQPGPASYPSPVPASQGFPQPTPQPSAYAPPPLAPRGRLVVVGSNVALPFPPGKTEIIIGREDPVSGVFPDIDLTDHGGDEGGVSRQHARILIQGENFFIEDLNSTNFTFLNQQKLPPRQPQALNSGDEVRLGRVKLLFQA